MVSYLGPLLSGRTKNMLCCILTDEDNLVSRYFRLFFCFPEAEMVFEIEIVHYMEIKFVAKIINCCTK